MNKRPLLILQIPCMEQGTDHYVLPSNLDKVYSNHPALGLSTEIAVQRYAYAADSCGIPKAREVLHIPRLAAGQRREPPLCQGLREKGMENPDLRMIVTAL